ncbi:MAG: hypothetical protein K8R02_03395 [Anaerohalosphaeraceae bacterium]|nr:hypothetical protein [Anaerohalosphaeraceae bacterium]
MVTGPKEKEPDSSINILIRELAIPFLGSLVPGTYLWMGIIFSIIPPIALLLGVFSINTSGVSFDLLSYLSTIIQNIRSGSWILFLVISYVLGAIISMQDPKITDQRSFKRICKHFLDKNIEIGNHMACTSMKTCEYPYPNLYDYVKKRGLNHLLQLIPWGEVPDIKSKAYINKLKLHIELSSPDAYRILVRHEAHIRMTNTVWHSSILIRYCCLFGIIVTLFSLIISIFNPTQGKPFYSILRYTLSSVAFPAFTLLISEYIRVNIEKVFHWQRLRELFFILETYYKICGNDAGKC